MKTIITCAPGGAPRVEEMAEGLEIMQALVGGMIEVRPLEPGIDLWFNEEGIGLGLEPNRVFTDDSGVEWPILGKIFISGHDASTGESVSLTPEQVTKWLARVEESPCWCVLRACGRCGGKPYVNDDHKRWGYTICCSACYDGPEDGNIASATTRAAAIADWKERQIEIEEEGAS